MVDVVAFPGVQQGRTDNNMGVHCHTCPNLVGVEVRVQAPTFLDFPCDHSSGEFACTVESRADIAMAFPSSSRNFSAGIPAPVPLECNRRAIAEHIPMGEIREEKTRP